MTEVRFCQACGKELPTSARLRTPPVEFVVCPSCGAAVAVMPLDEHEMRGERPGGATERVAVPGHSLRQGANLADLIQKRIGRPPLWAWIVVVVGVLAVSALVYGSSQSRLVAKATAVPTASSIEQIRAVSTFYDAISKHDYATAWFLLSPAFRTGLTFAQFKEGYATTQSVRANVSAVPGAPQKVRTAVDAIDLVNGVPVHSHLEGSWVLVWSATDHRWLLDQGYFTTTSTNAPQTPR
jgi:hypothetical protein